jgi:flagellin-like protein
MDTFTNDDRAVSPVIGVILMVAITVLLAATAATFFFGLTDGQNTQGISTVAFDTDYEQGGSDVLSFTHSSGKTLTAEDLQIVISGSASVDGRYDVDASGTPSGPDFGYASSDDLSAGSSITISKSTLDVAFDLDLKGATIRLVEERSAGSDSSTIAKWSGSSA